MKLFLLFTALMLVIGSAEVVFAVNITTNPTPTVVATWTQEPVQLLNSNVTRGTTLVSFPPTSSSGGTIGEGLFDVILFRALEYLANGNNYVLRIRISDAMDNAITYSFPFEIDAPVQTITLESPLNGGTTNQTFNLTVTSEFPSECRWDLERGYLSQASSFNIMRRFNETIPSTGPALRHTVIDFLNVTGRTLQPNQPLSVSITCFDGETYTPEVFEITYLTTPPTISISSSPQPIIDLNQPWTTLTVQGNQDIWCRPIEQPSGVQGLARFGDDEYASYGRQIETRYNDYPDNDIDSRLLELTCLNRAGMSVQQNYTVQFDYSEELSIAFTSPAAVRTSSYDLTFTTTKLANCSVRNGQTYLEVTPNTEHASSFRVDDIDLTNRVTTFVAQCETEWDGLATEEFSVIRDTQAPVLTAVVTEPNTCGLNEIRFRINATDGVNGTGIDIIEYSVRTASNNIILGARNISAPDDLFVETPRINLVNGTQLIIRARVFDGAGNPSSYDEESTTATGANLDACDREPPEVTVYQRQTTGGTNATLICDDDQSGCQPTYRFTLKPVNQSGACVVNQSQTPVAVGTTRLVTQESIYCYRVSDNNGNVVEGQQRIYMNQSNPGVLTEVLPQNISGTCSDGSKGVGETDTDCGGFVCTSEGKTCAAGKTCSINNDCASGICTLGVCEASSCDNGEQDGRETDIDCGGNCPACSAGERCTVSSDCSAGLSCISRLCTRASEEQTPLYEEESSGSLLKLIIILLGTLMMIGGTGYALLYEEPKRKTTAGDNTSNEVNLNEPLARFRPRGTEHGDELTSAHPVDTPESRKRREKMRERKRAERDSTIKAFENVDDFTALEHVTHTDVENAFKNLERDDATQAIRTLINDEKLSEKDVAIALKDLESSGNLDGDAIDDLRTAFAITETTATAGETPAVVSSESDEDAIAALNTIISEPETPTKKKKKRGRT